MKQRTTANLLPFFSPVTFARNLSYSGPSNLGIPGIQKSETAVIAATTHAIRKYDSYQLHTRPLITSTMSAGSAKIGAPVAEGGRDKATAIMPAGHGQSRKARAEKIQEKRAAIGGSITEWSVTVFHGAVDVKSEFAPHVSHGSRLTQSTLAARRHRSRQRQDALYCRRPSDKPLRRPPSGPRLLPSNQASAYRSLPSTHLQGDSRRIRTMAYVL